MDMVSNFRASFGSYLLALLFISLPALADNGDIKWSVKPDEGRSFYGLTITQNTIVAIDGKSVIAFTFDGEEKWRNTIDTSWFPEASESDWLSIGRSTIVSTTQGVIFVNSLWGDNDYITALDINGKHLWNQRVGTWVLGGSPSVNLMLGSDNKLYSQVSGDQYYASFFNSFRLEEQSTSIVLENESSIGVGAYVSSASSATDGTLYMVYYRGAIDSKLNALNTDYSVKWETEWNFNGLYRAPIIGRDGTLYFQDLPKTAEDKFALVATTPDGTPKWRLEEAFDSLVIGTNENVIGIDNNWGSTATLKSVDTEGGLNWTVELEQPSYYAPTIAEDGSLLLTSRNTLIALTESGELSWQTEFDDVVKNSARILDDGTILIRGENAIYAVESEAGKLADTAWPMYSANNHNSFSHYGDLDSDGLVDALDEDDDNDSYSDLEDAFPRDSSEHTDSDNDGLGNNADEDDDNDGMPDSFELEQGLNPLEPADAAMDSDKDGFPNLLEYKQGTGIFDPEDYPGKIERSGGALWYLLALTALAGMTRIRFKS